jgi:hypothetical protein
VSVNASPPPALPLYGSSWTNKTESPARHGSQLESTWNKRFPCITPDLEANKEAKGTNLFSVTPRTIRVYNAAVDVNIADIKEVIVLQAMPPASKVMRGHVVNLAEFADEL